ncbi:hypothetical protein RUND412_005793 [Rhizina undulata]
MDHYSSNNVSANTSRHTSTVSIFSLNPFNHSHSRNSTPPTPSCSPGLFTPPPYPPPDVSASPESPHRLHPAQYRMPEKPVRETHSLDLAFDPVSGRKHVNHYSIIEEIGRGVHGKVKLGADLEHGGLVAIKIVERSQGRPRLGRRGDARDAELKVRREIAILKKCRHENVVRLLEVIDDPQSKKVYLILEYVQLGEISWRAKGDPDVVHRERRRLRHQMREKKTAENTNGEKIRRRKRKKAQFWSLEFASDSESSESSSYRTPRLPRLPEANTADIPPLDSDNDQSHQPSFGAVDYSSGSDSSLEDWSYVPTLTIEQARSTFRDTVLGLEYLHYHGIIHRDIKPANLLWTHDHRVKISDFGVSFLGRPIRDDDGDGTEDEYPTGLEQNELELAKTAGTPAFFAPELCHVDPDKPRPQITCAIDVWALGVTLYCLIFARCPFMADSEYALLQAIAKDELVIPKRRLRPQRLPGNRTHLAPPAPEELLEQETERIEADLQDLLKRLLTKDPTQRITLKEVKRHPWVLHGITDPCKWVDETDPERLSHGNKIEVTTEDVEKAVSNAGMLGRARSAIKKAGDWYKGLRRRASSTANVLTMSSNKDREDIPEMDEITRRLQLSTLSKDDSDKELQWMGRINGWREDDKLHPLATSTTTESTLSSDASHFQHYGGYDGSSDFLSIRTVSPCPSSHESHENRLRRKRSVCLLGAPLLRRRLTNSSNQGSTKTSASTSPCISSHENSLTAMKAESTAALATPNVSNGGLFGSNIIGVLTGVPGVMGENGWRY